MEKALKIIVIIIMALKAGVEVFESSQKSKA